MKSIPLIAGSDRLSIGVVGCGYWGSKHVRVMHSNTAVDVCAIDSDPIMRSSIGQAFPTIPVFDSLAKALPHIDAVIIATPAQSHFDLALLSLRAGKHVLVEKPFTTNVTDAGLLVREAQVAERVLMVGHTFLFVPAIRELKARIHKGELGRIKYIHSSRLNLGLHRRDVNVIWDLAPHDIAIVNYLLDSRPTSVTAWGASLTFRGLADLAYIRLDYGDLGISAYAHMSWLDPKKSRTLTVVGSRRMAICDDIAEERLRIYDRGLNGQDEDPVLHERPLSYRYGEITSPFVSGEEPLYLEAQSFVDAIRNGSSPACSGEEGIVTVAVLEAIDESLRTQSSVTVDYRGIGVDAGTPLPVSALHAIRNAGLTR